MTFVMHTLKTVAYRRKTRIIICLFSANYSYNEQSITALTKFRSKVRFFVDYLRKK